MSPSFRDLLRLIRLKQWYKNTVIFVPLIFSAKFFDQSSLLLILLGFLSLGLFSSSSYILNDFRDVEKDKKHPEKKLRPLASGRISKTLALIISIAFFICGGVLALFLSEGFFYSAMALFALSQLYTLFLREIIFLDIIVISLNFVIRAVSGIFLIGTDISYWIILSTFFLSVLLVSGKRISELNMENLKTYRRAYNKNDFQVLNLLCILSVSSVVIFFCIYSILFNKTVLLLSLPIAIYLLLLFLREVYLGSEKARNPEKFVLEPKIILGIILWAIVIVLALYSV